MRLRLTSLAERFAVCQLSADAPVPSWTAGALASVTRTAQELSIVCPERAVPETTRAERGWRCLKVDGPLGFELTGVLSALTGPLAEAAVPVFVLCTYETDYLLVKEDRLALACAALERAGHVVEAGDG